MTGGVCGLLSSASLHTTTTTTTTIGRTTPTASTNGILCWWLRCSHHTPSMPVAVLTTTTPIFRPPSPHLLAQRQPLQQSLQQQTRAFHGTSSQWVHHAEQKKESLEQLRQRIAQKKELKQRQKEDAELDPQAAFLASLTDPLVKQAYTEIAEEERENQAQGRHPQATAHHRVSLFSTSRVPRKHFNPKHK
eukprot:TRINITY_DN1629_c0_g1_i2.p1 TRINITY_DN1629_c0_g1~~TRINITY_DN1629_c0_g1_i2.p1  ORF type:complete len:208 (-),score=54.66 TRINITY_DN1629_c0_g1_i2:7-579(-)